MVYQYPALLDLGLLVGLGLWVGGQRLKPCLPMKLPDRYSGVDAHDLEPGSETQGRRARGMFHLGQ
ncbi:MAG: hypothetical protein IPK63_15405 [Candidatus Competibacteraceae bacterium]|nr:hypothetical protein [Candidatus Competibacteraceae bacterium]